jgi:hypothetical protein
MAMTSVACTRAATIRCIAPNDILHKRHGVRRLLMELPVQSRFINDPKHRRERAQAGALADQ